MFSLITLTGLTFILAKVLKKDSNFEEEINSKKTKKFITSAYVFEIVIAMVLVYFVSGYFKYYAIAIASNSMYPTFERGSVAIIQKVDEDYSKLKVGDIIAYHYQNRIIAHRIAKITELDGIRYFYTKGDSNNTMDNYVVRQEMIMGTIDAYIPFLGYPTVLLNDLLTD
jgi:signal peptidase